MYKKNKHVNKKSWKNKKDVAKGPSFLNHNTVLTPW
jgi:hypothetical protein